MGNPTISEHRGRRVGPQGGLRANRRSTTGDGRAAANHSPADSRGGGPLGSSPWPALGNSTGKGWDDIQPPFGEGEGGGERPGRAEGGAKKKIGSASTLGGS